MVLGFCSGPSPGPPRPPRGSSPPLSGASGVCGWYIQRSVFTVRTKHVEEKAFKNASYLL